MGQALAHGQKSFNAVKIGLDFRDRAKLYARINARVDEMIAAGLVDEDEKFAGADMQNRLTGYRIQRIFEYGFDDITLVAEQ